MAHVTPNYEVNVAKRHPATVPQHFCTIERGFMLQSEAEKKFRELTKIFGPEYELSLTFWDCSGHTVETSDGKIKGGKAV